MKNNFQIFLLRNMHKKEKNLNSQLNVESSIRKSSNTSRYIANQLQIPLTSRFALSGLDTSETEACSFLSFGRKHQFSVIIFMHY